MSFRQIQIRSTSNLNATLETPLPFYWFKRILNSMHAVMNVLRFPQVISVGLYLDECTPTRTQIFCVYFYYEIRFYCEKLGHEFTVTATGIHSLEPPCMLERDRLMIKRNSKHLEHLALITLIVPRWERDYTCQNMIYDLLHNIGKLMQVNDRLIKFCETVNR